MRLFLIGFPAALLASGCADSPPPHSLPSALAAPGAPVPIPRGGGDGAPVFGEGVASDWQGNVYYNELDGNDRTMQLRAGRESAGPWRKAADDPNGMWLDGRNRIVICQQRALVRVRAGDAFDNRTDTLFRYEGEDLNDVTGDSGGNLFFTNFAGNTLFFRNAATGDTKAVVTGLGRPNGVEWDEERKRLYVNLYGDGRTVLYDVAEDHSLSNRRDFAVVPAGDGITLDERGNVYAVSFSTGIVHVFDPDAGKLGEIILAGRQLTNLGFGGADCGTLYFVTHAGLYKLPMKVKGYKCGRPGSSIGMPASPQAALR